MKALGTETRVSSDRRLYRVVERGVSPDEHPQAPGSGRAPDWESIRLFLEIVRRGSFRSASESLGISINVLRRKIDELERELGLKLLTRHVDGVRVTSEAEQILATAEQMATMKRAIPGPEWLVINHAGHPVHFEFPEIVGPRIQDFLRRSA